MNFIGHATVALWSRADPRFVLGSMLPDFASMAATRVASAAGQAGALAEGIALHHRTDAVFHGVRPFTSLLQGALDVLTELGVPRGTARAVGHIGVEMLIDGELVHAPGVAEAYTAALEAGEPLDGTFTDAAGDTRFRLLRARLLAHGAPYDYREPGSVLRRLQYTLQSRPRLAIDARSATLIAETLPALQRKVIGELPALLASLRAALS